MKRGEREIKRIQRLTRIALWLLERNIIGFDEYCLLSYVITRSKRNQETLFSTQELKVFNSLTNEKGSYNIPPINAVLSNLANKKLIAGVDRKNGYLIGLTDYFEKMLSCIGKP